MQFPTTHWSIVLAAGQHMSPDSRDAMLVLCCDYWRPLYALIRRQGYDAHAAFLNKLLEKNYLAVVHREKGKFRSFLLKALGHFLANEYDRARAQKRGGGQVPVPLDFHSAEHQYSLEPAHGLTAEQIFEKRWVLAILERVLCHLEDEYARKGRLELFERLRCFLSGDKSAASYAGIAADLSRHSSHSAASAIRIVGRVGRCVPGCTGWRA